MRSDVPTKPRPKRAGDDTFPLAQSLRLAVMRLARRLRQSADTGITPSMLSALSSIERLGPLSLGDLASAERVTPATLSVIVGRLERAGLIERESDPADGRVVLVSVSPHGKRLMERSRRRKTAYLARGLELLDPSDREALARALPALERLLSVGEEER
jgi:DNA-binding MarR family transcriptional regulator